MTDDNLDDTQQSVGNQAIIAQDAIQRNALYREIWNAAIEVAALVSETKYAPQFWVTEAIRSLKK